MPTRPAPLLLAVALTDDAPRPHAAIWRAGALAAEAAGVDLVTVESASADAVLIAAQLAAVTTRIGIIPLAPTTTTEPFHISTSIATLDQASGGRAGWLAEVWPQPEAQGLVTWDVPSDVLGDAAEHISTVRALWDSWEHGAEIRDSATDRFVDRERLHHVEFRGLHLAVRGPSITPRPPQGHPPIAVRVRGERDLELARQHADLAFVADGTAAPAADDLARVLEIELHADGDPAVRIAAAEAEGFAGVLVRSGDVGQSLAALAPVLAGRPRPVTDTLRARLGLAPAPNRFATA